MPGTMGLETAPKESPGRGQRFKRAQRRETLEKGFREDRDMRTKGTQREQQSSAVWAVPCPREKVPRDLRLRHEGGVRNKALRNRQTCGSPQWPALCQYLRPPLPVPNVWILFEYPGSPLQVLTSHNLAS